MKQCKITLLQNSLLCDHLFALIFKWNDEISPPLPGQFCTIRVSEGSVPLLRRPFAFSNYSPETNRASIIYKQWGPATDILAGKQSGDTLDIIAPLGNSFIPFISPSMNILIGGGTGLGPVYFLQNYLNKSEVPSITILGFKSQEQVPQLEYPKNSITAICTEDGSAGFKGTTIDFLDTLSNDQLSKATFFCCGPLPMMKACHTFAQKRGRECYVSMEQIMACGVGACMGCTVKVHGPQEYARVCTEGPVFNSKNIIWT